MIDTAKERSFKLGHPLAYFYCESASRNTPSASDLFESLIKQILMYLIATQHPCPKSIMTQLREHYRYGGTQPDFEDVTEIFSSLFNYECLETAIYIIDGLDGLQCDDIIPVLSVFHDLFRKPAKQKLFLSSRNEPHYKVSINKMIPNILHIPVQEGNLEDIQSYINAMVSDKTSFVRELTENKILAQQVVSKLLSSAKGMLVAPCLQ